jgi:hypothetical protein
VNAAARIAVVGVVVLAAAAGIYAGVSSPHRGGSAQQHDPARAKVSGGPMGPVHGLMLLPLADPDRRVPTADLSR